MLKLYSFFWDCRRQGFLDGLFIAEEKDVERLIGRTVYFGEVLGKHSDVFGTIQREEIKELSDDQDFISKLQECVGRDDTISGYNPFDYIELDADEDFDEDELDDEEGVVQV